jgi:hypothetical protein
MRIRAATSARASTAESTLSMLEQNADRGERGTCGADLPPFVDALLARRLSQNILVDVSEKWNVHFVDI